MALRYSRMNQALHWITALCMFAILPLAWVMTDAKRDTPGLSDMYNWHKTFGIVVLAVTAFRIAWRFIDKPPPYPPQVAAWDRGVAHLTYWLFFAVLLWMPITGFIMSTSEGRVTKLFDLIPLPLLWGRNEKLADSTGDLHAWGQWAVYGLILLHLSGAAFHVIWGRDGVLGRMLPAGAIGPTEP